MFPRADTSKDAALRLIGRTVVNFQRLEHNLKLAARLGPVQGTVDKIQRDIAKRHERAAGLTLGQAIQAWLDYCYGQPKPETAISDLFDVTFHMTITLESDPESQARHAKGLRALLEVRNNLIHSRLAQFEWESQEACEALIADLEKINSSISEQLDYTAALLKTIAEVHKEYAEALAAEFVRTTPVGAE